MEKRNVKAAIVGLGTVGTMFLNNLSEKEDQGIKIVVAAENNENAPGVRLARSRGIKVVSDSSEIIAMGDGVDIIFDLTDDRHAKMELRINLAKSGNMHTVIASEILAHLIWRLLTEDEG